MKKHPLPLAMMLLAATALSACASTAERLSRVGQAPAISPILNPTEQKDYRPVSMPMPANQPTPNEVNSLWRGGSRAHSACLRTRDLSDAPSAPSPSTSASATSRTSTAASAGASG